MNVLAKDVMQRNVKTVRPDLRLMELEQRFVKEGVSGFPVVDDEKILGVVSAADILKKLGEQRRGAEIDWAYYSGDPEVSRVPMLNDWVSEDLGKRMDHLKVSDVMCEQVISVAPKDTLHKVAALMHEKRIHRLLVVDADQLVGIVSSLDIVRICGDAHVEILFKRPELLDF